jgi:hypothetical protein
MQDQLKCVVRQSSSNSVITIALICVTTRNFNLRVTTIMFWWTKRILVLCNLSWIFYEASEYQFPVTGRREATCRRRAHFFDLPRNTSRCLRSFAILEMKIQLGGTHGWNVMTRNLWRDLRANRWRAVVHERTPRRSALAETGECTPLFVCRALDMFRRECCYILFVILPTVSLKFWRGFVTFGAFLAAGRCIFLVSLGGIRQTW